MKILQNITMGLFTVLFTVVANITSAEERMYGSFIYNSEIPNALFFMDKIKNGDDFELRKALRNHDIDTMVLASPGGSVWAGLSMAGIIFDKELRVYVPPKGVCASACSFMFFGGAERLNEGQLGVHQFASSDTSATENAVKTQAQSQFTVSEIIGFLNEFDTPRFVLERMFEDREMYWFSEEETAQLNSEEFAQEPEILSAISNYTRKKLTEAKEEEATKPKYSDKELIALIQKRLNEIGCSAGVADGIWGRRTNAAAVSFAKKVNLPTSSADLISVSFVEALANAKEGACPKPKPKPRVREIKSFYSNYTISCSEVVPGKYANGGVITNVRYNSSTERGIASLRWLKQKQQQFTFAKNSKKTILVTSRGVSGSIPVVINNNGKAVSFSWQMPGNRYCKRYTAQAS
jgi:peptidoglycan hydrolase-like protein with peptidoglycan-binding domain